MRRQLLRSPLNIGLRSDFAAFWSLSTFSSQEFFVTFRTELKSEAPFPVPFPVPDFFLSYPEKFAVSLLSLQRMTHETTPMMVMSVRMMNDDDAMKSVRRMSSDSDSERPSPKSLAAAFSP